MMIGGKEKDMLAFLSTVTGDGSLRKEQSSVHSVVHRPGHSSGDLEQQQKNLHIHFHLCCASCDMCVCALAFTKLGHSLK
uniref:Uncharacterized protein n=1 Tax=Oryza brachyantha TaxID=4533 RepID=J3NAL6_ORYBR